MSQENIDEITLWYRTIRKVAFHDKEVHCKSGTVKSIDLPGIVDADGYDGDYTVHVEPDDCAGGLHFCRITADHNAPGLLFIPKIGSKVFYDFLDKHNAIIVQMSEVEQAIIKVYDNTITLSKDHIQLQRRQSQLQLLPDPNDDSKDIIQFNDGGNGGMVKVGELVNRLNALEDAFNELQQLYNEHSHVVDITHAIASNFTDGIITKVFIANSSVSETKISEIENPQIKH